jgi:hypothetical protein
LHHSGAVSSAVGLFSPQKAAADPQEPMKVDEDPAYAALVEFLITQLGPENPKAQKKGFFTNVPEKISLLHPFQADLGNVSKIVVENVFQSNTRPLLLQFVAKGSSLCSPVIFKCGDDLRQDVACLQVFRLLNYLWDSEGLVYGDSKEPVCAFVYGCMPLSSSIGFIEFLDGCESLKNVVRVAVHNFDNQAKERMVASAAGSYIGAFMLGVRDRHYDNILVRKDGLMFHIDFGYALGNTVAFDADAIAITPELQTVMGDHWMPFVNLCVRAFAVARKYKDLLIPYIDMMFSPFPGNNAVQCLQSTLMLDDNLATASKKLKIQIQTAPTNARTRFKNAVHGIKAKT